ncbi:TPA: hypothetical protein ACGR4L_001059 [Serratia marcescens]
MKKRQEAPCALEVSSLLGLSGAVEVWGSEHVPLYQRVALWGWHLGRPFSRHDVAKVFGISLDSAGNVMSYLLHIPLYSITDWHRSSISDSHPFDQPGT